MRSTALGQPVLQAGAALHELGALEDRLSLREAGRSAAHAAQLHDVLAFTRTAERAGHGVTATAQLALVLSCSEWRANDLMVQAGLLVLLPGAQEELGGGGLTVEQWATAARGLAALAPGDAQLVWSRLLARLAADRALGSSYPPARLAELLRRLVAELLPGELAAQRRRNGSGPGGDDVTYDRNDDGSANLHLLGMSASNAHAALSNLAARSEPWGDWDDRSPGRRRLDAAVDLLTGRQVLPCQRHGPDSGSPSERIPATACGCPAGSPAPCGAAVQVLVPLATALGLSDLPGELAGHGPLDTQALADLLSVGPRLSAVFVDEHGVPVAVGDRAVDVPPRDPLGLRTALLDLARGRPGELFPTHPLDHPPPGRPPPSPGAGSHDGPSGPYSIRPLLRRMLLLRTLRCEWPGCGARAARCDLDHDDAWPHGPTCACNLGALCRRHHRVKQLGWTKQRLPGGVVRWTSPTGRTSASPPQLPPVPPVVRALRPLPSPDDELSPAQAEDELRWERPWDPGWDDPRAWSPPDAELDPRDDRDVVGEAIASGETAWTLDLRDPYRWGEVPPASE